MNAVLERKQVVGYLRFLAKSSLAEIPKEFLERNPEINDASVRLMASGLMSAAAQIEEGIIDMADFSDEA